MKSWQRRNPYPNEKGDPFINALNALTEKWTLLVIRHLHTQGPTRFVEIQRALDCSSEQLQVVLKRMEVRGLISRTRYREVPPRVNYELTPAGAAAMLVVDVLGSWGKRHEVRDPSRVLTAS